MSLIQGTSSQQEGRQQLNQRPLTVEERAEQVVKDVEKSRARMYELSGKKSLETILISQMDEDYQMIDAHINDTLKRKIEQFEFIDLARLLPRNKGASLEEDQQQCLEIVNRNGVSLLSPVADRDNLSINSYGRWEQAFRIYLNVLTKKHPGKASELLQYNHVIHSTSISYVWDNVYAYDKEFHYHILRHPMRSWSVILNQAWTMLIKDQIRNNPIFSKGSNNQNKGGEPCHRFNRGKCTFGLSCRYDHRCSVKKCGKFGHGAYMCHLRNQGED